MRDEQTERTEQSRVIQLLRSPSFWLVVVAVAYFAVQVIVIDERRFLEWDEAVYVGNATSRFPAPSFAEHRSSGIVWIVRPILLVSDSWVALRLYLAVVSASALGLAYSRWIRPAGWLAPVGMAVFALGWLPVFYGSEVSPNLFVAAVAVGAAGSLAAFVAGGRRADLGVLGLFVAGAVFLRLTDGLILAAGLGLAAVVVMRLRDTVRVFGAIAVGFGIGILPWMVESISRFGGPLERLRVASTIVGGGPTWNVAEHLYLLDGPLVGPDPLEEVSSVVVVLLLGYAVLAGIGAAVGRERPGVRIAFGLGLLLAFPYFVYVEALAPRFLMPSMALMVIPIASGAFHLWRVRTSSGIAAVLFLLIASLWSVSVADRTESERFAKRELVRRVAVSVDEVTDGERCEFLSQYGYPPIMIEAGCEGARAKLDGLSCQLRQIQERNQGTDIVVALVSEPPKDVENYLVPVSATDLPRDWTLYVVDAGSFVPCVAD